jgi:hypothetical protein
MSESERAAPKDGWEKAKALSVIFAALVIPIVIAIIGYFVNASLKEREVQGKFVELAVAILREPVKGEDRPIRIWATEVVNKYSGVPFSDQTRGVLIDKLSLPWDPSTENYIVAKAFASSGELANELRKGLAELGFYKGPPTNDPRIDFSELREAIILFQRARGILPDGIVGPMTVREVRRALEEKRSQSSKK